MNNYEVIVYWSKEDECFVAEIPELQGCMAHGVTDLEALQNVKEAKELWIETAIELGRTIPEPKLRYVFA